MAFRSGFVAIVGRPNVGKSTLMNSVVGEKVAIMSDKPQTTRNKIRCIYTTDSAQVIFVDTPGIHKPKHRLGEVLNQAALSTLKEVDAILFVVEATAQPGPGDEFIIEHLVKVNTPVLLVVNKIDQLPDKQAVLPIIEAYRDLLPFAEIVPVSALYRDNLDRLVEVLFNYLPEGPMYYPPDMVTDHPERFIVAEIIREKILHLTRDEVPHSVAVEVEEMKERSSNLVYVRANIYVERESQKGIIVGHQGRMLKQVGQLARQDLENLLGSKLYLDLWVKVKKDWRNREQILRQFGYREED
ncbi:GTP-binding protein Era [Carboxydocella thermautotrophica]|nr:GTP-binding protein Era [Carboxydocella thermautotrophica]